MLFAAEPRTQLNFDDVEVLSVIKLMGKVTGKSFVFNNRELKGKKITLLSNQKFTAKEAYKIFEAILDVNGLTLIEEGKTFRIVQSKNAKNIPVPLYDPESKSVSSSFVTRVIPVLHADAKTIRSSLAPLVSRSALLIVLTGLNALILKDTKDNSDQFAGLVKLLDEMDDPIMSVSMELVPVVHANANELVNLLNKIFTTVVPKGGGKVKLKISADNRTNSIIVIGQEKSIQKIKSLVQQLDSKDEVNFGNINVLSLSMEIIPVKYANANDIAGLISKIFASKKSVKKGDKAVSELKIYGYVRTNNIIVVAHPKLTEKIKEVIRQLDTKEDVNSENIRILSLNLEMIPIKHANADDIAGLILKMFAPQKTSKKAAPITTDQKLRVFADTRTNNVIIVAHPKLTAKIKEVIKQLDTEEDVDSENVRILSLNLEMVPIKYANAFDIAELLNKMFTPQTTAKKGTPITKNQKLRVFADKWTNNVILIGFPQTLEKIKKIIVQLDTRIESEQGNIRVYRLKNANAKNIAEVLQKVSKTFKGPNKKTNDGKKVTAEEEDITIIADIPTNSLVIYAPQNIFLAIENVLEQLDVVRPQVFIQALIMEVKLDKSLDLGIEWQAGDLREIDGRDSLVSVGGVGSTGGAKSFESVAGGSPGAVVGVVGGPITFGGQEFSSFNAFIKATQTDSEIDILSNPKILTLNNEEAEIKVAEIIPTIGSTKVDSSGNSTTTVDYKEVGVLLKITPQINSDNTVELQIEQTSSNIIDGKVGAFADSAITTLNRTLKAKVNVFDGQTIALGGLIHEDLTEVHTKTPCLGDIPLLGWLFKTKSTRAKKTNLLIFLTPHVVKSHQDIAEFTNDAKIEHKNARLGRFRIDVTKEFDIPVLRAAEENILEEEEELAREEAEEAAELAAEEAEMNQQ